MPINEYKRSRPKDKKTALGQSAKRRAVMYAGSPFCGLCGRRMILRRFQDKALTEEHKWLAATIDHIVPKSKGGENRPDNYMLVCKLCNTLKASLSVAEFKERQANGTLPKRAALTELYAKSKIPQLKPERPENIPWWYC